MFISKPSEKGEYIEVEHKKQYPTTPETGRRGGSVKPVKERRREDENQKEGEEKGEGEGEPGLRGPPQVESPIAMAPATLPSFPPPRPQGAVLEGEAREQRPS